MNKELHDFLVERCKELRLSLRSLSMNAGLSPSTVHGIINRKYQPTVFSLNRLADYLNVKRQYLWQLAGLVKDMDYDAETSFGDPQLKFHFAQADNLPDPAKHLIVSIITAIMAYLEGGGEILEHGRTFTISGDNKGLTCPFNQVVCQASYCEKCETYRGWRQGEGHD